MRRSPLLLLAITACHAVPPSTATADDVLAATRRALHYQHAPYDPANPRATCKVWHDAFAPDGRQISKGLGGEFEHHRGLFVGWNQVQCGERRFDFWHCNRGESQRHVTFVPPAELGLDGDWQVAEVAWCDAEGRAIVNERRALHARAIDAATTAIEVVLELRTADQAVQLGGDPQHSGHQFRADNVFAAKDAAKVRYLRPPSAQAMPDDVWTGCDWIAAVLPFADGPVTVVRVEAAGNPGPVRWSTRDYGRFGATFAARLEPGRPLRLGYTYLVAVGELDGDACARLVAAARR